MMETKVLTDEGRGYAIITKGDYSTLVVIENLRCGIISVTHKVDSSVPFVAYAYVARTATDAYQKYLHLLGKMVLKGFNSKYFKNPIYSEHCRNGHPGGIGKDEWEAWAISMVCKYVDAQLY